MKFYRSDENHPNRGTFAWKDLPPLAAPKQRRDWSFAAALAVVFLIAAFIVAVFWAVLSW